MHYVILKRDRRALTVSGPGCPSPHISTPSKLARQSNELGEMSKVIGNTKGGPNIGSIGN